MRPRRTNAPHRRTRFARALGLTALLSVLAPAAAHANSAPVCSPVSATVDSGKSITIHPSCTDADGDTLHPLLGSDVAHGRLSQTAAGDGWTYTPAQGYGGLDSFQYVASDRPPPGPFGADNVSNAATVTITVNPPAPTPPPTDRDQDGIPDRTDSCPTVPGTADYNGCPPDQDGDDIPDATDKCPTQDQRIEGKDGCPAPWLPNLHAASARAAHAIDTALRSARRRAALRRTLHLEIHLKLPAGLPHRRYFTVAVIPIGIPFPRPYLRARAHCVPGRRCTVVLDTDRDALDALRHPSVHIKSFSCSTSMFNPGHRTDGELAPVTLRGLVPANRTKR